MILSNIAFDEKARAANKMTMSPQPLARHKLTKRCFVWSAQDPEHAAADRDGVDVYARATTIRRTEDNIADTVYTDAIWQ